MKHHVIQDVVVNQVYLGGDGPDKGLVETLGFGTGPKGTKQQRNKKYTSLDSKIAGVVC